MSCIECVESMMVKIDPEVLAKTASTTLVLVRAELWHYAWEKVKKYKSDFISIFIYLQFYTVHVHVHVYFIFYFFP